MPNKSKRNGPMTIIRKIAKAMGTKVKFGRQTITPNNHWCQLVDVVAANHTMAMGWGASYLEAATQLLQRLTARYWIKFTEIKGKQISIYYRIIPTENGYQVISSTDYMDKELVRIKTH